MPVTGRPPGWLAGGFWRNAKTFGATVATNFGGAAIGMATGVLAARVLGPSGRGDLAAAVQWATVSMSIADLGLGLAIAQYAGHSPERRGELWWTALLVASIWGGMAAIVGEGILVNLVQPASSNALRVALLVTPFGLALGYQTYLLLGAGQIMAQNAVRLLVSAAYLSGCAVATMLGWNSAIAFALAFVGSQLLGAVAAASILWRTTRPRPLTEPDLLRKLLGFGVKTQTASIASTVSLRIDQLLLAYLVTPAELGLYAVAVAVAGVVGPVFTASALVVIPKLAAAQSNQERGRKLCREVVFSLTLCLPLVALGVMFMPKLIQVLFGEAFLEAAKPARWLMVASLFQGTNAVAGNALRAMGRPGGPAMAELGGMILTAALLLLLLPGMGGLGAAIASLLAYALTTSIYAYLLISGLRQGDTPRARPGGRTRGKNEA